MTERTDAVVVGGGAIGCAVAWRLAGSGLRVLVLERDRPGGGATAASGGMLSPLAEADRPGPFLELGLASLRRWPDFAAELQSVSGVHLDYSRGGKLQVGLDEEDERRLDRQLTWLREAGHEVERLDGEAARRLEPALSPAVRAALLLSPDHSVDSERLGRALWLAAERAGASFRLGQPAASLLRTGDGRAAGVELPDGGRIQADAVVLAAGCWSAALAGLPRQLPVFPVRGQMAAIVTVPPLLGRVALGAGCYMVPRADGRVLVGSTMEHVGFRPEPTAGGIAALLSSAAAVAPAAAGARFAGAWAGLRPGTADGLPILGEDPDAPGLFYATGHFRNGILLTPVTGEVVAALVAREPSPHELAAFAPDRFGTGSA